MKFSTSLVGATHFSPPWHVSRLTWPTTPALRTLTRLGLAGQGQVAWDGFQGRSSPETMVFPMKTMVFPMKWGGGFDKKKRPNQSIEWYWLNMDPIDWPDWYPWSPGSSGNSSAFVWGWGAPVIFAHLPIILTDDITIFGFNSQVFGRTSEQVITRCYTSTQYELKWCFRIYCRLFREFSGIYFFFVPWRILKVVPIAEVEDYPNAEQLHGGIGWTIEPWLTSS